MAGSLTATLVCGLQTAALAHSSGSNHGSEPCGQASGIPHNRVSKGNNTTHKFSWIGNLGEGIPYLWVRVQEVIAKYNEQQSHISLSIVSDSVTKDVYLWDFAQGTNLPSAWTDCDPDFTNEGPSGASRAGGTVYCYVQDIYFNSSYLAANFHYESTDNDRADADGEVATLHKVCHEFGHTMGLRHQEYAYRSSCLYEKPGRDGPKELNADDIAHLNSMY